MLGLAMEKIERKVFEAKPWKAFRKNRLLVIV
jgi:hypothetical protein